MYNITMKICKILDCDKPSKAKGICAMHYARLTRHGDVNYVTTYPAKTCKINNCDKSAHYKNRGRRGWCCMHYSRWLLHGNPYTDMKRKHYSCTIAGCDNKHSGKGLCSNHYAYKRRNEKGRGHRRYYKDLLWNQGFVCNICSINIKYGDGDVDHVIPVTKGGGDDISNLQVLCHACNMRKFNHYDIFTNMYTLIASG